MIAPLEKIPGGWRGEIDELFYEVYFIDVFPPRPEEGRPYTFDFQVTGGLVPRGEVEHVSFGGEKGGEIFIVERSSKCIPCDTQQVKGSDHLLAVLANLAARHVHNKRKENPT